MKAFLQLIRIQNLFIVALTQYMMRYCIINPMLKKINVVQGEEIIRLPEFELQFGNIDFLLLVLSTAFLTAAGYVINDYFDTRTDLLNRPGTVIVGKTISRRAAMAIHIILNVLGIGFGFYIAFLVGIPFLGFIFLIVSGLLWFYSTTYKRQFLIGNIIVSLLTGLVPLMVVLFEIPLLIKEYAQVLIQYNANLNYIIAWVSGFTFFAIITTLTREVIKDMEDFEGDNAYGRKTMPIVIGLKNSKRMVVGLIVITISALAFVYFTYLRDNITLIYLLLALLVPYIILIYKIVRASTKNNYHVASNLTKLIMLAGILYSLVVYFIITYKF